MRQTKISLLAKPMMKLAQRFPIEVSGSLFFRSLGIKADIFETYRSKERQKELLDKGKSWTLDSMHCKGLAIDIVLAEKEQGIVQEYIWHEVFKGEKIYEVLSRMGVSAGFRSLGYSYGTDYYHLELPITFQGNAPHCYAFAIVNCLQKHKKEWRALHANICAVRAANIVQYIEEHKLLRGLPGALQAARALGYIGGFGSFKPKDVNTWTELNGRMLLISQKKKNMGKVNRWKQHAKNIEAGLGIFNHATCFCHYEGGKITVRNSHEKYPTYDLDTSLLDSSVQRFYEIS